ncbi:MAG: hypothetical protein ACYDHX_06180 [Methanothrix sp.]
MEDEMKCSSITPEIFALFLWQINFNKCALYIYHTSSIAQSSKVYCIYAKKKFFGETAAPHPPEAAGIAFID